MVATQSGDYYAIFHKGYVEVRLADEEPKKEESVATKIVPMPKVYLGYDFIAGSSRYSTPGKKRVTIKVITFEGGKPVKSFGVEKFAALTGIDQPPGSCIKLSKSVAAKIL